MNFKKGIVVREQDQITVVWQHAEHYTSVTWMHLVPRRPAVLIGDAGSSVARPPREFH